MINAILDSQGRAPYVWAGSFSLPHHKNLRVLQHVYPEIRQQELRKKKKKKSMAGAEVSWRGVRQQDVSCQSPGRPSLLILPPNYLMAWPILCWMFLSDWRSIQVLIKQASLVHRFQGFSLMLHNTVISVFPYIQIICLSSNIYYII